MSKLLASWRLLEQQAEYIYRSHAGAGIPQVYILESELPRPSIEEDYLVLTGGEQYLYNALLDRVGVHVSS